LSSRRPRALWLIKGLGTGGAERLLVSTAEALRHEVDVDVAHLWREPVRMRTDLLRAGVDVIWLGVESAADPRWLLRARRLVRRNAYDVVHVHGAAVAVLYRLLNLTIPRRQRPRVVLTQHNDWRLASRRARLMEQSTYRLDSARFAVSQTTWESMPRRVRSRTQVLVHGVPLADIHALRTEREAVRAELGTRPGDVVAMTVANLRPEKGYPDLLEAAALALPRAPALRFVAVGGGPPGADVGLQAAIERAGLADRFHFLGVREDAVRLLAGADLFVLASRTEGFPIALMEALGMGLPVVSTGVGGIPEAVHDGTEGLLVPPGRPDLLAEALVRLAGDGTQRQRMGEAAAQRGRQYDIRLAAGRTAEVYRELTGLSVPAVGPGVGGAGVDGATRHQVVLSSTATSERAVRRRR
jgi:glycosyltransferase involved in cell wall biosynthesis